MRDTSSSDRHLLLFAAWAAVKPDFRHIFPKVAWTRVPSSCVLLTWSWCKKLVLLEVGLEGVSRIVRNNGHVGLITCLCGPVQPNGQTVRHCAEGFVHAVDHVLLVSRLFVVSVLRWL